MGEAEKLDQRKKSSVVVEELVADYQLAMMIGFQLAAEKAPRQPAQLVATMLHSELQHAIRYKLYPVYALYAASACGLL